MKILSHCTCAFTNCDILDTSLTEAGSVMGLRNSEFERAWGPDQYIPKKKKKKKKRRRRNIAMTHLDI